MVQTKLKTKAYAATSATEPLKPFEFERRDPRATDVLIDIKFCGVCHSDLHQARGEWGNSIFPMVPGHEIVGVVTSVGKDVKKFKVGDKVGVGCMVDSCRNCQYCKRGEEQYCEGNKPVLTYNDVEKDGVTPTYGGYSTQVVVDEAFVVRVPDGLALDKAAPLLCAGITTYSPLRRWQCGPGKNVAVVGLGGLGHMAVKIARAMGAHVTVLSQSEKKRPDAERLGAHDYYATGDASTFKKAAKKFDLIIDTVSAQHDINSYLGLLKVDGSIVLVGAPPEALPVGAFNLILGRRSLSGSAIGGLRETQEMLDFCAKHDLGADIEVIPIEKINEAYERLEKGDVRYRFVIDCESLKK
jgi:alcohol dehydrogenase (NADP+)